MAETRSTSCYNPEEEGSIKNRPSTFPTCGFLLLLTVVIAVSVVFVIIWLMVLPIPIDVEVEDMRASSYNITPDKYLHAMFDFTLGFNNPSRIFAISYRWLHVTIERDNHTLAFKEYHQPIAQPPRNVAFLHGTMMSSSNGNPLDDKTLKDLKPTSSGDISIVDIRIVAMIELWMRHWESKAHVIGTFCSNVTVHPPDNTSPSKLTTCSVYL